MSRRASLSSHEEVYVAAGSLQPVAKQSKADEFLWRYGA